MFNNVTIQANLTRDPELRDSYNGNKVCSLGLACNDKSSGKETTLFINAVVFGKMADVCGKYLRKGSQVIVSGKLTMDNWVDKEGNKITSFSIITKSIDFIGGGASGNKGSAPSKQDASQPEMPFGGDDIPF